MRCAESDSSTMAPANIAVSLITRRPAPDNRGKPNSPLPRLGTHTSGVVTRNDKVPMVIMMARISPMIPIRGKNNPKKTSIPMVQIKAPRPWAKVYVPFA